MEERRQSRARRQRVQVAHKPKAATQDIVGTPQPSAPIPRKWHRQYRRLMELRDHFTQRQNELAHDALEEQPSFSSHMADAATDTYDRDLALGMLSSEQDALYQVEQALDRIRNGNYGICELTGKPIGPARLEAIPWTRFSASAEKQLEREGCRKHASLGPREAVTRESVPQSAEEEE
jgi:RNA polymerase-binding transcription factor DksA